MIGCITSIHGSLEEDKTNGNESTLGRFWLFVSLRLVHIDKVKPYLRTTPKSWIEGTNRAENEQQYANETEDAENEASAEQQQELEENEPNVEAPLQGSEASYDLAGGRLYERPRRTIR